MANSTQYGAFVNTTSVWDVQQLQQVDVTSPEFKELLVRLYQNVNNIALILNIKDTGMYQTSEFVNGQLFFPNPNNSSMTAAYPANRQIFRKVINFPQVLGVALGAGATAINHNINVTAATTFTRIYGVANDTAGNNYYPLPWASAAGATNIEVVVNATQVVVTNNSGITFDFCYVILEYIQS